MDYPRPELLQVADTVARDKGIDRDEVLLAMEQAIQKAGRSKYGQEYDIRAEIDRKNGEIRLMRFREVADPVANEATQIPLAEAKRLNPAVSPPRRRSRSSFRRCATPSASASSTSTRTASARSSTAW